MENQEQLAQTVFEHAEQEYSAFSEEMLTHQPQYIFDHAYEIATKRDLMMIFEDDDFSLPILRELARVEQPIASIYGDWLKKDENTMEALRDTVDGFAGGMIKAAAEQLYTDPAVPRYDKTFDEARAQDEIPLYRASFRRDLDCIKDYNEHINAAHESRTIPAFTRDWTARFGTARCKFVLGYTVKRADWDQRYAPAAKRDAAQYDYPREERYDPFVELGTNVHPCLVDCSYRALMDVERGKEPKKPQKNQPER